MTQIHKDIKKCGVSHGGRGNMEFSNSSSEATVSFWRKKKLKIKTLKIISIN